MTNELLFHWPGFLLRHVENVNFLYILAYFVFISIGMTSKESPAI